MTFDTLDSGERREFNTGSVRDAAEGKGRYDLVSPIALRRLALLYERGAKKYAARNWEKGQPLSVFMDCATRHLQKHLEGHRDEDHLAAVAWNAFAAIHVEEMIERGLLPAELNDLPNYMVPPTPPVGSEDYAIFVILPQGEGASEHMMPNTKPSLEMAKAAVEILRQKHGYGQREFIIRDIATGKQMLRVYPWTSPLVKLEAPEVMPPDEPELDPQRPSTERVIMHLREAHKVAAAELGKRSIQEIENRVDPDEVEG